MNLPFLVKISIKNERLLSVLFIANLKMNT
jgi:hypothetical protein